MISTLSYLLSGAILLTDTVDNYFDINCSSKSEHKTEKEKPNEQNEQYNRNTYKSCKMCRSALKLVRCSSNKDSLPIFVNKGRKRQ